MSFNWHQALAHSPQILGCGRQQELVLRTTEPAKPEPIQLHDALEMREQHLHFLAIPA